MSTNDFIYAAVLGGIGLVYFLYGFWCGQKDRYDKAVFFVSIACYFAIMSLHQVVVSFCEWSGFTIRL